MAAFLKQLHQQTVVLKPTQTVVRTVEGNLHLESKFGERVDGKLPSQADAFAENEPASSDNAAEEAKRKALIKSRILAKIRMESRIEEERRVKVADKVLVASPAEMHGFMMDPSSHAPLLVKHCDEEARPGYQSKKAHEYNDTPEVLQQKVELIASLMKKGKNVIAYTGAGISTSSGINDYATRGNAKSGRPKLRSWFDAQPTVCHRTLTALHRAGHLHNWIQQNHDGLPQKAGYPQHCINEIHGAWYDPSNAVVKMSGNLRDDLFESLLQWEERADLCITLGTSLCGMNADRMATSPARRALKEWNGNKNSGQKWWSSHKSSNKRKENTKHFGTIIVGLQQTQFDGLASVRVFADLEHFSHLLAKELALDVHPPQPYRLPALPRGSELASDVYRIPFDRKGMPDHSGAKQQLDLRNGARVRITGGPHKGDCGVVTGKNREGHYRITFQHKLKPTSKSTVPFARILGLWWVHSGCLGHGVTPGGLFPVVNV